MHIEYIKFLKKELINKYNRFFYYKYSLIAYSAICCIEEKYEESQLYIECACKLQPKNVIAHTVAVSKKLLY